MTVSKQNCRCVHQAPDTREGWGEGREGGGEGSGSALQGLDVNFNSLVSSFVKDYSRKQITRSFDKKVVGKLFPWKFH